MKIEFTLRPSKLFSFLRNEGNRSVLMTESFYILIIVSINDKKKFDTTNLSRNFFKLK